MVTLRSSATTSDAAVELLREYFENRALTFPGGPSAYKTRFPDAADFEPPRGIFLVVEAENLAGDSADVGCGGIRAIDPSPTGLVRYEVKHLFLQQHVRGRGYSHLLIDELERRAIGFGAEELVLDTNDSLEAAARLYRSSGLTTIEPYNDNPNANRWYAKRL